MPLDRVDACGPMGPGAKKAADKVNNLAEGEFATYTQPRGRQPLCLLPNPLILLEPARGVKPPTN